MIVYSKFLNVVGSLLVRRQACISAGLWGALDPVHLGPAIPSEDFWEVTQGLALDFQSPVEFAGYPCQPRLVRLKEAGLQFIKFLTRDVLEQSTADLNGGFWDNLV